MNSRITKTLAIAALMAGSAGAAHAEGWYGRADVGSSVDGNVDIGSSHPSFGGKVNTKPDWYDGLGMGYAFQNGFRVEGELSHRYNDLEAPARVDQGGDLHTWA